MSRNWTRLARVSALLFVAGCIPRATAGGASGAALPQNNSPDAKQCPAEGVIDDAEDNNNQVSPNKGRTGYWYTFADKAGATIKPPTGDQGGTFNMTPGGANGSTQAARATGKVGSGAIVFAGMGFNFVDPKGVYNASSYKGIAFYAKAGPGATKVRVKIPDADTDPDGKVCKECFNDFGMDIELTSTWTRYVIPFSATTQLSGWGTPRPAAIDPTRIYGVQWQVNTPGAAFDIWVDDVQFTGCP